MYTNFEKEKLGKTFQYYRKTKNIKWDVLKKVSTMSKTTYSKMSKGIILNNDKYYNEFLRCFDLKYNAIKGFDIWLNNYIIKLNDALEMYNQKQIIDINREFLKILENHNNFPIYEQYFYAFENIFRYYLQNKYLNIHEIKRNILLIESKMYDDIIDAYLLEIMYISNINVIGDEIIRKKLVKMMELNNHPILYQLKANNERCERCLSKALDIHEYQLKYWNEKQNHYRKIKALNGMFVIYKSIDESKTNRLINELMKCKNSDSVPNALIQTINYNIAMYYYLNKRYEEAYELFIENIEKYNEVKEWIYIGSICTHLSKELPDSILNVDYSNSPYKLYIDYFKMKKEGKTDKELIEFVNTTLFYEKLSKVEYLEPLWRIYENELDCFSKKSKRNFEAYMTFKYNMDKTCKYR